MKLVNSSFGKWLLGPWDSKSPVEIGYIKGGEHKGERHLHEAVYEYYLVTQGWLMVEVEDIRYDLGEGDVLMVEPGEKHAAIRGSDDLECFLIKYPHRPEDKTVVR